VEEEETPPASRGRQWLVCISPKWETASGSFMQKTVKRHTICIKLEKPLLFDIARSRKGGTLFYQNLKNTSDVEWERSPELMFGASRPNRLERKPTFYARCVVGR
jgi:hypothetical protein